jgi:hypothetical protein
MFFSPSLIILDFLNTLNIILALSFLTICMGYDPDLLALLGPAGAMICVSALVQMVPRPLLVELPQPRDFFWICASDMA